MKRRIATADCETDPFKYGRSPKPFLWAFYDGTGEPEYFERTADFVARIKRFAGIVYAHNGGKFDWHFLLPFIETRTPVMVINGRLAKMKLGKCELRDSYNVLPVPLSRLNKDSIEYWKMEAEHRAAHWQKIKDYLRGDVVYLWEALSRFFGDFGHGLTLAGIAFKQWRDMDGLIPSSTKKFFDDMRPWYFGGRVSPFRPGVHVGRFSILDINSAYPFAMIHDHPTGIGPEIRTRVPDSWLPRSFLEIEAESFGAFPVRRDDNGIDFPTGRGTYFVTGHEFEAALDTNSVRNVTIRRALVFNRSVNFTPYVERFYKLKAEAEAKKDKVLREFAKLFLNSLYGKHAANPAKYREHIIDEYGEMPRDGYLPDALLGDGLQIYSRPLPEEKQTYYNVATAASITGYVRAHLWRSLLKVSAPYYCDTDSIICEDGAALDLSPQLGAWKNEGTAVKLAIAGKKLYAAFLDKQGTCRCKEKRCEIHKVASKGVRLSADEIERVAHGEEIIYRSDAPTWSLTPRKGHSEFLTRRVRKTVDGVSSIGIQ